MLGPPPKIVHTVLHGNMTVMSLDHRISQWTGKVFQEMNVGVLWDYNHLDISKNGDTILSHPGAWIRKRPFSFALSSNSFVAFI